LVFTESGTWRQDGGKEIRFTNVFRWTLVDDRVRLEHLRYGADKPVFLFKMAMGPDGTWREINPHPCKDDCYRATLQLKDDQIFVSWRVHGPKRNEVIDYVYI
jgi:hypothetical protein